jgi:hypothetical protein
MVTAACRKCGRILEVTEVRPTNSTVVLCPDGHTSYRTKHGAAEAPLVISAGESGQRGLARISVRCDVAAAGMYARPFPMKDVLLALNGPPGGPLVVMIWDCSTLETGDLEVVARAKLDDASAMPLEFGGPDRGVVLGQEQVGLTFRTGTGPTRIAWFAFLARRSGGTVLVGLGSSGRSDRPVSAAAILANSSIAAAVRTLASE